MWSGEAHRAFQAFLSGLELGHLCHPCGCYKGEGEGWLPAVQIHPQEGEGFVPPSPAGQSPPRPV